MRKILLVEDEKMIRYGIYVMIENSGIPYREITECRNGKEAVEHLKRECFDLVLTDIKMPFMDGLELVKWMTENLEEEQSPLIVAVSGYSEFEYAKGMLKCGAMDYLLKPVDHQELARILWKAEERIRKRGGAEKSAPQEAEGESSLTEVSRHKMQSAVDYIRQNYRNPLDMAEVSNHVNMNYSMFSAVFKEYTGENFSSYLRKLRLAKSRKLLRNTDMNIQEIAQDVGFEDARHFAKVFKEENGCTPTHYREYPDKEKN